MAAVCRRLAPLVPAALGHLPRCTLCTWKPELRLDRIKMSFARSSGAGGQNVNKVNTKAELRFNLSESSDWLPADVAERLASMYNKHVNKEGDFIVTSEKHRTQHGNITEAQSKLRRMLAKAAVPPKTRKQWKGLSEATKAARRDSKRRRSEVKARRRGGGDD